MTEAERLPPPLPPRLDWFVHTQMGQLARSRVPDWFHGTITREAAEDLLASEPLGSFLIRVSHSHVGYTLSYKAPSCCRHFMVKLLDDGSLVIPGEKVAHASLAALVAFHQQKPVWPHEELLTQPCGQKDPANVDYEDLFLYSNTLAEEATCPVTAPEQVPARPALPHQAPAGRGPAQEAAASRPAEAPLGQACRRLWRSLKARPPLPLKSHLAALSLSSLRDAWPSSVTRGSRAQAHSRQYSAEAAWRDSVSRDPCVATAFDPSQPQAPRHRDASSRKAARPMSWSGVATGVRGWHQKVARALSSQETKLEPGDVAEPQVDWLPEEYLPPPPFAPGYC
uniref:Hematopoietic SH2 domain containing n=1 Tax=Sciurus vulgaris TaxID=55149 RepID=A0A8D2DNR8_SCIVU